MEFTLGVIIGIYGVIAVIIFYVVYLIEVKLDIPYSSSENREINGLSHNRLRQLIESIVAETLRLPNLSSIRKSDQPDDDSDQLQEAATTANNGGSGQYFEPKVYQELLATAVLNKIVDTHGKGRMLSGSSPNLSTGCDKNHNTLHKQSTTSSECSSIEPRSENSFTEADKMLSGGEEMKKCANLSPCGSYSNLIIDNLYTGRTSSMLSDYIASHMVPLPDISGAATTTTEIDSEDEEDNLSRASTVSHDDTWEKNWLFKKKPNKGKMSSINSVGMLVPAPKDDVRAQIGDRTADEISDLSEADSDSQESSSSLSSSSLIDFVKGVATNIDPPVKHFDQASLISSSSLPDYEPIYRETLNEHVKVMDDGGKVAQPKISSSRNSEPAKHSKHIFAPGSDPILPPPHDFSDDDDRESMVKGDELDRSNGIADDSTDDEETHSPLSSSFSGPLSGSIAEREYQKWYNAVEMPNNPYSPEALKRRLSTSSERFIDLPNINSTSQTNPARMIPSNRSDSGELKQQRDYKRYSRDYYINDAKYSSGMKKRSSSENISISETSAPALIEVNRCENQFKFNPTAVGCRSKPSATPNVRRVSTTTRRKLNFSSCLDGDGGGDGDEILRKKSPSSPSSSSTSTDNSNRCFTPNPNILSRFEKQLLHKNLKRNSFRAISATTKEFVLNPLFDSEHFYSGKNVNNCENEDSGVDSCLNGC